MEKITKKDTTIIKRVLRDVPKNMHHSMDGAIPFKFNGEELIGFCDGHRIMASENDFDFPKVENPVNLHSIMGKMENHNFENNGVMIEIDKDKVKEAKTNNRGRRTGNLLPFVIRTQYGRIGVNPSFLMDAMEFTKTNIMFVDKTIYDENGTYKYVLYFVNEKEKRYSVTLPVNLGNNKDLREDLIIQEVSIPEETANTNTNTEEKEKKMGKKENKTETKKTKVKLGASMKNVDLIAEAKKENGITIAVDTFNGWKRKGKRVKKGEKAVFKTPIWKPFKVKVETEEVEEGEEEVEKTRMRLINTAFFTENQVEKRRENKNV